MEKKASLAQALQRNVFMILLYTFLATMAVLVLLLGASYVRRFQDSLPAPSGYEADFFAARLLPTDVPASYRGKRSTRNTEYDGGHGEKFTYMVNGLDPMVFVSQEIVIFDTVVSAKKEFDTQVIEYSEKPFKLKEFSDQEQNPVNTEQFAVGCNVPSTMTIPGVWTGTSQNCAALLLYENIFVIVRGRVFPDQLLQMSDFERIVHHADQRVPSVFKVLPRSE